MQKTKSPTQDQPARFVGAARLAILFDPPLSIGFIRKLQNEGMIPSVRLGRRVLFDPKDVFESISRKRGTEAAK